MRGTLPGALALAAVVAPAAMLAFAIHFESARRGCYWEWTDRERAAYNTAILASPLVSALLVFAAIVVARPRRRYLLASLAAIGVGIIVSVVAIGVLYAGSYCE